MTAVELERLTALESEASQHRQTAEPLRCLFARAVELHQDDAATLAAQITQLDAQARQIDYRAAKLRVEIIEALATPEDRS